MGMRNFCMIAGIKSGREWISKNYFEGSLMLFIKRNYLGWIFLIKYLRKRKFWIRLWPCLKLGRKMWGF
jgi:hypothetical protein